MDVLKQLWKWLDGKKTYAVGVVMLLHAVVVVGWVNGDWAGAQAEALTALGLMGLRNALPTAKRG